MAAPFPQPANINNAATLVESERMVGAPWGRWDWSPPKDLWDKYYPYQLAILKVGAGDSVASYWVHEGLTFTLPYAPESMQTLMPFAISVQATQDGVVEQHGGVPFRQIIFQGSFGVHFSRPTTPPMTTGTLGILGGNLGLGTLTALQGFTDAARSQTGEAVPPENLISESDPMSTGYWQSLQLRRFLESYAEMKKTVAGKYMRLALITWKERDAWLVTPQRFEVSRQAQSPYEYRYSLQFQSWKRINPMDIGNYNGAELNLKKFTKLTPGILARIANAVDKARKVISAIIATVVAVRADVENVMGILRSMAFLVKSMMGAILTIVELPAAVAATFMASITETWEVLKGAFSATAVDPSVFNQVGNVNIEVNQVKKGSMSYSPTLKKLLNDQTGGAYSFQQGLNLSSLPTSTAQQNAIEAERKRVTSFSTQDFKDQRQTLLNFLAGYSDQVGLGNATYNLEMGRDPVAQSRVASLDDIRAMHALGEVIDAYSYFIGGGPPQQAPTVIEYVAGLANANGIAMRVPKSKFVVPFPYGGSLEKLSQQYLGDAGRWMEIAELNELRAPYVDEVGSLKPLLTNGRGNILIVQSATGLLIGQPVWLYSLTVQAEKRYILNIQPTGVGSTWVLTLDGLNDLAKLTTADKANIKYYQSGTVNSQRVLFIPSDDEAPEDVLKYIPSGDDFSRILDKGEVDGMLTASGDLVVTPDGDWPFVLGYANLVQWTRVALNTKLGSMPLHPGFGLESQVGESNADFSADRLLDEVKKTLLVNNSISGVESASIALNGPVVALSLSLQVRGVDALLPITFDISPTN
jgi:hypothetical protein